MSESQTLHALSRNTVSLIGSCQVITSVYSVVKELVENSLDANASSVDIKLEDYGLEKIDVCDNGSGIKTVDVPFMGKRHFTSKISSSEDLNFLTTYGFRGEALGSLCAVSNVTITTKTAEDQLSYVYTIGPEGDILDKKPSHNGKGTIVSSKRLFHNIPVRKQYYSESQRKKEDLKRIEHLLMIYAIVKPDLRLTLKHGKDIVFQKTAMKDVKTALLSVMGRQVVNQMLYKEKFCEDLKVKISAFLPKPGSDTKDMSLSSSDKTFIAVNNRPVSVSVLNKVLKSYYSNCHGLEIYHHPVCFVSLDISPNQVDVNVDPNKSKVFFQQKADIIIALEEILVEIYGPLENVPSWHYREPGDEDESPKKMYGAAKLKTPTRPLIIYMKRPGDSETTTSIEISDKKINDTSPQDEPTAKTVSSLPSFSVAFHSNRSGEIPSDSNVENSSGLCTESSGTNTTNDDQVNVNPSPIQEDTDSSHKSLGCDTDTHATLKVGGEKAADDNDISKDESENLDVLISTLNNNNVVSLSSSSENMTTPSVQEVTVIESSQVDNAEVETSACKESDGKVISNENTKDVNNEMSEIDIDPSDWSRGNISVGNTLLQPVKLLPPSSAHKPGKRPPSPKALESSQPKRKSAKLTILSNQATLFDMMITQKVKEPESPFTLFYQEKCPSLSQEHPTEDTAQLKERLKGDWESMTDDERMSYREKCWNDAKRYEKDKNALNKQCKSGKEQKSTKKTTLKKRLYCKECSIKVPMNKIRNQVKTISNNDSDPKMIGPAQQSNDVWLCTLHNKLYLVNAWRLSEVSLYTKLKAEHILRGQSCDPIVLDSRTINDQGMLALESLAKKCAGIGTYFHISDERLVANGFDVKCHFDLIGNLEYELVGICDVIPSYDVKDLNTVLGVISADEGVLLSETRTLKAAYYLQSEAVRMARQNTGQKSSCDVQTLLKGAMTKTDQPCLHHKPIFQELFDLSTCQSDDNLSH